MTNFRPIEYLPTSKLFAEQRSHWHTPFKFNGKELDEETGYYYYGARYYTPELGVWLSVDPLADKYPSMSAFMYCAGNPVVLVDPDGRELILVITGTEAEAATSNLQQSTTLALSRDKETGIVTATGTPQTENDHRLIEVINDTKHTAKIEASSFNEINYEGQLYGSHGGSFMGSNYNISEDGTKTGSATNKVNPKKLTLIDLFFGKRGQSMLHEVTEAFVAAKISAKDEKKTGPAFVNIPHPIYDTAHEKAVWQPEVTNPEIFDLIPSIRQSYKMLMR